MLDIYGDYLYERHEYRQAAIRESFLQMVATCPLMNISVFVEAKRLKKAMIAYERALLWRELFELAIQVDENEPSPEAGDDVENELVNMAYRVAGSVTVP